MGNRTFVTLGAAARLVGRSRVRLKQWEAAGLIKPRRNKAGVRIFSRKDLERLREIAETRRPGRPSNSAKA